MRGFERKESISSFFNMPRLDEQAAVNGLVELAHALVVGILGL